MRTLVIAALATLTVISMAALRLHNDALLRVQIHFWLMRHSEETALMGFVAFVAAGMLLIAFVQQRR